MVIGGESNVKSGFGFSFIKTSTVYTFHWICKTGDIVTRRCFVKKMFLKYLQNSHKNICVKKSLFSNRLRSTALLKKRPWHRCFTVNLICLVFTFTVEKIVEDCYTFCVWQYTFFYKQHFFFNSASMLLTFSWIELQMLLRCCLIHKSIVILRYFLYLEYLCQCLDSKYFETFWCSTKFSFYCKWSEVLLLVINMVYTNCLTTCQTT